MRRFVPLAAAAAAALSLAAPAGAGHQLAHAAPFHAMTLEQIAGYETRSLRFHRAVVGRWVAATFTPSRRGLAAGPFQPSWRWCGRLAMSTPPDVCWHELAAAWTLRELDATRARIRRVEQLAAASAATSCGASAAACSWYWQADTQCEVSHEGGFGSVSPDGTYAGRFQMDYSFETETPFGRAMEARYGRASGWPEGAQIEHAHEVWLYAGWGRWPPYYRYGCASQGTGPVSGAV